MVDFCVKCRNLTKRFTPQKVKPIRRRERSASNGTPVLEGVSEDWTEQSLHDAVMAASAVRLEDRQVLAAARRHLRQGIDARRRV
jgi:hypothetical protein